MTLLLTSSDPNEQARRYARGFPAEHGLNLLSRPWRADNSGQEPAYRRLFVDAPASWRGRLRPLPAQ